jgi:hypothetical protein
MLDAIEGGHGDGRYPPIKMDSMSMIFLFVAKRVQFGQANLRIMPVAVPNL